MLMEELYKCSVLDIFTTNSYIMYVRSYEQAFSDLHKILTVPSACALVSTSISSLRPSSIDFCSSGRCLSASNACSPVLLANGPYFWWRVDKGDVLVLADEEK